jgi:hypothetical protein
MNTMTNEQRDYLVKRLNEITRDKVRAKELALYGAGGATQPTWGQVFAAIKSGEIVLKQGTESLTRAYLMPTDVEWPALTAKATELEEYKDLLRIERQRIIDDLWLGGAADALTDYANL